MRGHEVKQFNVKSVIGSWAGLITYMGPVKKLFILAIAISAVAAALFVWGPNILSDMIDEIENMINNPGQNIDAIAAIGVIAIAVYAVGGILSYLQSCITVTLANKVAGELRHDIVSKINCIPFSEIDSMSRGGIASLLTNDADLLGREMSTSLNVFISAAVIIIGSVIVMMVNSWALAVISLGIAVMSLLVIRIIVKMSQKHFKTQQDALGEMTGFVTETCCNQEIVRIYNAESKITARFNEINEKLRKSAFHSCTKSTMMVPVMTFAKQLSFAVVCIAGAILVINNVISFGTVAAFILYVKMFMTEVGKLSNAAISIQIVAACYGRIFDFLNKEEMKQEFETEKLCVKGSVEFKDVHFSYTPGNEILKGVSFKVDAGQRVTIVGRSGCGKSTIINLLMKFYEVDSGDILIDGISIKNISRNRVHEQFNMIDQNSWLFEGTFRENIVHNRTDVSDTMILQALDGSGAYDYVMSFPNKYDSPIPTDTAISACQKQQLSISGAMITDSPIVLCDEATDMLDIINGQNVQNALDKMCINKTSFSITHKMSEAADSDLIIVLDCGLVTETGTHKELMKLDGTYAKLYNNECLDVNER